MATLKAARNDEPAASDDAHENIDWRAMAGMAAMFLFVFAVVQFLLRGQERTTTVGNPFLGADGRGRPQTGRPKPPDANDLILGPTKLYRRGDLVEVRGQIRNSSKFMLRKAVVSVYFQLRNGRVLGPATGAVFKVEPGETVVFSVPHTLDIDKKEIRTLTWRPSVSGAVWGADVGR